MGTELRLRKAEPPFYLYRVKPGCEHRVRVPVRTNNRILRPGDTILLSRAEWLAFRDKFEPADPYGRKFED